MYKMPFKLRELIWQIRYNGNNILHVSLINAVLLIRTANNAGLLDKVV
jgi:hypothetical protein